MKQEEVRQKIRSLTQDIKTFTPTQPTDCVELEALITALQAVYRDQCPPL